MPTPGSPADDITFRPSNAPTPNFSGVALPPVLRELRGPANTNPSDMTALANRLRGIRFDISPDSSPQTPKLIPSPTTDGVKPVALDFETPTSTSTDKENLPSFDSTVEQDAQSLSGSKRRPRSRPFGEMIATSAPLPSSLADTSPSLEDNKSVSPPSTASSLPTVAWDAEEKDLIGPRGASIHDDNSPILPDVTWEKDDMELTQLGVGMPHKTGHGPCTISPKKTESAEAENSGPVLTEFSQPNPSALDAPAEKDSPSDRVMPPAGLNEGLNEGPNEGLVPNFAISAPSQAPPTPPHAKDATLVELDQVSNYLGILGLSKEKGRGWPERCDAMNNLRVVINGNMSVEVEKLLNLELPDLASKLNDQLDNLRPTIIASALELFGAVVQSKLTVSEFLTDVFPSVMDLASGSSLRASDAAASLSLALHYRPDLADILSDVDDPARLAELLGELAERGTLSEVDRERASKALEIVRKMYPNELSLDMDTETPRPTPKHTKPAAATFVNAPATMATPTRHAAPIPAVAPVLRTSGSRTAVPAPGTPSSTRSAAPEVVSTPTLGRPNTTSVAQSPRGGTPAHNATAQSPVPRKVEEGTPSMHRTSFETTPSSRVMSARLSSRLSWRAKLQTPGLISGHGFPITNESYNARANEMPPASGTPARSPPGRGSEKLVLPPPSPQSVRKARIYTSEDLEEARTAAMRVAMEEASHARAKEKELLLKELEDLRDSLKRERNDKRELQSVLAEFEMTMQKMIAQSNSQASQQQVALETEKSRLKVNLLDLTEAFEKLKEKYEAAKQEIALREKQEARHIEQMNDLKKNMVALQKWSNDLKANAEKKLVKSFEAVTTYRASYLEKEAHATKAISDLERTKTELDKTVQTLSSTAANVSRLEGEVHRLQDAKSEANGQLSSAKVSLARLSALRDRLQRELDEAQKELGETRAKLTELMAAASRAEEAQKTIDGITSENQSLKALAYDDMTRIRKLEGDLEEKDRELEELNTICEEAMTQMEQMKLVQGVGP